MDISKIFVESLKKFGKKKSACKNDFWYNFVTNGIIEQNDSWKKHYFFVMGFNFQESFQKTLNNNYFILKSVMDK